MKSKVVVIGAGPAGMMAAMTAAKEHDVFLLDGNERIGKKLFITGKGRCNVTNVKDISEFFDYIYGNPHFLYSALYSFTNEDTINFFENEGIKLKAERGGRMFPVSDKSSDIIKGLNNGLKKSKVKVLLNHKVTDMIVENNAIKEIVINNKEHMKADYFILATGGVSYPLTGSTGDGHKFSKSMGHHVTELKPSLVPLELNNEFSKELMALTLRNVNVTLLEGNKKVYSEQGEMMFTHFGASGPLILKASRFVKTSKKYNLVIDLKPALNFAELDKRVQKDFKEFINKEFKHALDKLLPKKLIPVIIKLSNIPEDKKVNEITKEERKALVHAMKEFTIEVKGHRSIAEAIVTAGGVDTKEIDPSTMKSKIINNLAFAGELIDVDAFTGGYNVQIALSTGFIAGSNI